MSVLGCFKAYDIRGRLGDELNEEIAYLIGRACAGRFNVRRVALGGDVRPTSAQLKAALGRGFMDSGADVLDLGMVGTEGVYYAAQVLDVDMAIEVTASHNPIDYNGMKLVLRGGVPVSGDSGLGDVREIVERGLGDGETGDGRPEDGREEEGEHRRLDESRRRGALVCYDNRGAYVEHLLGYIDPSVIRPMRLVVNGGNGVAGPVVDALEKRFGELGVPVEFVKVHHAPDGTFPNGIPNPLLPANRKDTAEAVVAHGADMGIAWDGDFDRCFLYDENGEFIEGYYIVGLLGEAFLQKHPGARIIHDPRLTWNTIEVVTRAGGVPVQTKTGHAFIKERMRAEDAVYGGEMSAHHYFRDFGYCDSGMIPWLLVMELISRRNTPLSEMVRERIAAYPASGEINSRLEDAQKALDRVESRFAPKAEAIDRTDGLSLDFGTWRFNLRSSNTEPVVRLNVESRGDGLLMQEKTVEVLQVLKQD